MNITSVLWTIVICLLWKAQPCVINLQDCRCLKHGNQNILDCRNLQISSLPIIQLNKRFENVTFDRVDLSKSSITEISDDAFLNVRVREIKCTQCSRLQYISTHAFRGLAPTLENLTLHVNKEAIVLVPWNALHGTILPNLLFLSLQFFTITNLNDPIAFKNYNSLRGLSLLNCKIQTVSSLIFKHLSKLEHLDLSNNEITSLPVSTLRVLTELKTLQLDRNKIKTLGSNAFSFNTKLTSIKMSLNGLDTIQDNWQYGIQNSLKELMLRSNSIHASHLNKIRDLPLITIINLDHNKIAEIKNTMFQGLPKLETLSLARNVISALSASSFVLLPLLKNLSLSENAIKVLAKDTFKNLPKLLKIDLSQQVTNDYINIHPHSFIGTRFESLDLSRNNLSFPFVWKAIVTDTQTLLSLKLKKTGIKNLPDFVFKNMVYLKHLDLSENNIENITQRSFFGLHKTLESVDFSYNKLTTIDKCVFEKFIKLHTIELNGNTLNCNCGLRWLRSWVSKTLNQVLLQLLQWRCSDSIMFKDKNLKDFNCSPQFMATPCEKIILPDPRTGPSTTLSGSRTTLSYSTAKPTVYEHITVIINIANKTTSTALVTWSVNVDISIDYYQIKYFSNDHDVKESEKLHRGIRQYLLRNLRENTRYEVQLVAYMIDTKPFHADTKSFSTLNTVERTTAAIQEDPSRVRRIVIIVCSVIAGIILVGIIIAIVMFCLKMRKERENNKHVYANDVVTADIFSAQSFAQIDRTRVTNNHGVHRGNKSDSSRNNAIEISHIAFEGSNLCRDSAGSYQFLNEHPHYYVNSEGIINHAAPQSDVPQPIDNTIQLSKFHNLSTVL